MSKMLKAYDKWDLTGPVYIRSADIRTVREKEDLPRRYMVQIRGSEDWFFVNPFEYGDHRTYLATLGEFISWLEDWG